MKNIKNKVLSIKNTFWGKDKLYPLSVFLIKKLFFTYCLALIVISSFQIFLGYKQNKNRVIQNLHSVARDFEPGLILAIWDFQNTILESLTLGLINNPDITSATLLDEKNKVLFNYTSNYKNIISDELTIKHELYKTHKGEKRFLGTLILSSDKKIILKYLKNKYEEIFLINLLLLFLVVFILSFFSKKYLVNPLKSFSTELREISLEDIIPALDLKNIEILEIFQLKYTTNLLIQEIFVLKNNFSFLVKDLTETQKIITKQNETLEEEVKKRTKEVLEKELQFRSIFEQSNVGIAIVDVDGSILSCNESYAKFLEYEKPNELTGLNFTDFTHPEDIDLQLKLMEKFFSGKVSKERIEKRYITKNSKILWADLSATVIKNEKNMVTNFIAITVDITERKKNENELHRLYSLALDSSPLTGLPGNNSIRKRIEEVLLQKEKLCVIYADLDNFKAYNDNYGFAMGDKILTHIAKIFKYVAKELNLKEFFLGHIGGDDFVVLVPPEYVHRYTDLIIDDISSSIGGFYNKNDYHKGFINSFNRQGEAQEFPFVSISMAGIDLTQNNFSTYLEINDALSYAKKQAKNIHGNSFFLERRIRL